jgi:thiol-disulfide isomerase/thioredoxin
MMKPLCPKVCVCLLALFLLSCSDTADPESVVIGSHSPDFDLTSLDGSRVTSTSLKGEIVVLNFWATFCQPCRAEIPELNSFAASSGARVIGITLDPEGTRAVRQYEKEQNFKLNYTVLLGDEEIFTRFNGVGIPYTLVLDRTQRIVSIYRHPVDKKTLEQDLLKINQGGNGSVGIAGLH